MMKGYVPTPGPLADHIVNRLFEDAPPAEGDRILYPGVGEGPFVSAVDQYCEDHGYPVPDGVGIELDPEHVATARENHVDKNVDIQERDFLSDLSDLDNFDYIVGNPPYVPLEDLSEDEKTRYRDKFDTAVGRFDLYLLFFEQAISLLDQGGRIALITPEKYEYVDTGKPLREILTKHDVKLIEHVDEDSFSGYITFPTITVVEKTDVDNTTKIVRRDGTEDTVTLPEDGSSWASTIRESVAPDVDGGVTLGDVTQRVSCGVATGADRLFVQKKEEVPPQLKGEWTYPTTSGKKLKLNDGPDSGLVFICPYQDDGRLPEEDELGDFGDWAELHRDRLEDRSCVKKNKRPWYGWHENPPMEDILQPKLLCQDIAEKPQFWADEKGEVVPKHTVYYLIPEEHVNMRELQEYLNGPEARAWLEANCQKAANGYYRLQTRVMEDLPVPMKFGKTIQETLV